MVEATTNGRPVPASPFSCLFMVVTDRPQDEKRIRIPPTLLHALLAHYFATSSAEFELDLCSSVWRASWHRVK